MYKAIVTLLILVVFSSCSQKGFKKISSDENQPGYYSIYPINFIKAVYDSEFNFYGRTITGLTIIKKTDSSFRIVSMSELGIKYFDLEFFQNSNTEPKVHYIMDVLNKKPLVKRLTGDLEILFNNPGKCEKVKKYEGSVYILSEGVIYGISNSEIRDISKPKCIGSSKPLYLIQYNEASFPSRVDLKRSKFRISFVEIVK